MNTILVNQARDWGLGHHWLRNALTPVCYQILVWANYSLIFSSFQNIFEHKGIKNGCPCIVEIRDTQGCALVGDPAGAVGECRDVAKAQP